MKILCKVENAECPHELNICCGVCNFKDNCGNACPVCGVHPEKCEEAEVITEELTAFKAAVPETIGKMTQLIKLKKQMDEQEKQLKQALLEAMEHYGIKSFENDQIKLTYVEPTTRATIDTAKLKKFHPDVAELCTKTSDVSASVRVTLK